MPQGERVVAQTSPQDWKYVAEGGSTVVFSYTGPPNRTFDGTVLRLRKLAHNNVLSEEGTPRDVGEEEKEEPDDPTIMFQRSVIERVFPSQYLPHLRSVNIDGDWLQRLADLSEEQRPAVRRAKDHIDVSRRKGVLAPYLIGGDGWAVEIKPKWGFMPSPIHLSASSRPLKTKTCRFCMHAHLKKAQGEHVALGYCPLDLFSGIEARVVEALQALWDAWIDSAGEINNLRIFVEGQLLKPTDEPSSIEPLVCQLDLPPASELPPVRPLNDLRACFTSTLLPVLLETPVLRTLASLQRTLDPLDIEGLAALWDRAHAHESTPTPPLGSGAAEPTVDEWSHFVDTYLALNTARDRGLHSATEPRVDELRYYCLALLLSATFKDCSLIIRMRPPGGAIDGCGLRGTVTVIDLDVKSIARLGKWEGLDREIVATHARLPSPRQCVAELAVNVDHRPQSR